MDTTFFKSLCFPLLFTSLCSAQISSFPVSLCLPESHVTAMPNCDYVQNTYENCSSYSSNATIEACVCTQQLLSTIVDCESEFRISVASNEFDSSMQQVLANWHQECDRKIAFAPATPPLASLTVAANPEACLTLETTCSIMSSELSSCRAAYTAPVAFTSCICQPFIVSLASPCLYDGNRSCKLTTANLDNIPLYSWCSTTPPVAASSTFNPFSTITSSTAAPSTVSITPPAPTSTTSSPPSPAGTTKSSIGSSNALGASLLLKLGLGHALAAIL